MSDNSAKTSESASVEYIPDALGAIKLTAINKIGICPTPSESDTIPNEAGINVPTAQKCAEFRVIHRDDEEMVGIQGLLVKSNKVVASDLNNKKLKLLDQNGKILSSVDSKHYACGITHVDENTFATCAVNDRYVRLWTLKDNTIVGQDTVYDLGHEAHGLHFNGAYFCALNRHNKVISVLDGDGRKVREINIKKAFEGKIRLPFSDIHMDSATNNIYVSYADDVNQGGVVCLSVEGEARWTLPLPGLLCGITEIDGNLCVADSTLRCVHLFNKEGKYAGKLIEKKSVIDMPITLSYDNSTQKLFVGFEEKNITRSHTWDIFVYKVTATNDTESQR